MTSQHNAFLLPRRAWLAGAVWCGLAWAMPAAAHDFAAGALRIDHPYATPTGAGMVNGAVYFRAIENTGAEPDRLLSATTPIAQSVELHRMQVDDGVMRMRPIEAIELPAKTTISLRHGQPLHLMLMGLQRPLVVGERFALTLRFERAGEREVMVWVQQPRAGSAAHAH